MRACISFLLRAGLSLAFVGFLCTRVEWANLAEIWRRADWVLLGLASLTTPLLITLLAVRWRLFLVKQNMHLPYRTILSFVWTGQFFNAILPGSTGGDVSKIVQVCAAVPDRKADALVSVVTDRVCALVSIFCLAVVCFWFGPSSGIVIREVAQLGGIGSPVGFGFATLVIVTLCILALFARRPANRERMGRLIAALQVGLKWDATLVCALVLAIVIHMVAFAGFFIFARSLGIDLTFWSVLQFLPIVLIVTLLPVTVNGHGLREAVLILYFSQMGISMAGGAAYSTTEIVVALSVVCVGNDMLWSLPGGLLLLRKGA